MWVPKLNTPISYSTALVHLKKLVASININPKLIALHSLRVGGTTDAFRNNVKKRFIDRQGRWKCKRTKYRYARDTKKEFARALICKKY